MILRTASYRAWQPGMGSPVAISLLVPSWFGHEDHPVPRCVEITPRWSYFKAEPAEFERAYLDQLDRIGPQRIAQRLTRIAREAYQAPADVLVLLCFEPLRTECHRSLFTDWLLARTGELAAEATTPQPPRKEHEE